MKSYGTHLVVAIMSVFLLASSAVAGDMAGVMMKDGKMIMMENGKPMGPMKHDMTTTNGHTVRPDGTIKMPDGTEMRMKEGQTMTKAGTMTEVGKGMPNHKATGNGKAMPNGKTMPGGQGMPGGPGGPAGPGGKGGMNMEGKDM